MLTGLCFGSLNTFTGLELRSVQKIWKRIRKGEEPVPGHREQALRVYQRFQRTKLVDVPDSVSGYGIPFFLPSSKQRIIQIIFLARLRMVCMPSPS